MDREEEVDAATARLKESIAEARRAVERFEQTFDTSWRKENVDKAVKALKAREGQSRFTWKEGDVTFFSHTDRQEALRLAEDIAKANPGSKGADLLVRLTRTLLDRGEWSE